MQADKLRELRDLLSRATERPWLWSENGNIYGGPEGRFADVDEVAAVYTDDEANGSPNAPLIIAAINALPELLAIAEGAEADRADARRYRWLRNDSPDSWDVMRWIDSDTQEILYDESLDAAIDAALAGAVTAGDATNG